ncbi:hypothetical protein BJV78DRAFT_206581 [Lactifluus subvellereus]|nr:hypothetical protein BJV78DRAFT_206581 [Lactifluus subvellereus]
MWGPNQAIQTNQSPISYSGTDRERCYLAANRNMPPTSPAKSRPSPVATNQLPHEFPHTPCWHALVGYNGPSIKYLFSPLDNTFTPWEKRHEAHRTLRPRLLYTLTDSI